jgi:hypothetical protein
VLELSVGAVFFGGDSLTTSHVTPAAAATTTAMNTMKASTPRRFATGIRIAACHGHA